MSAPTTTFSSSGASLSRRFRLSLMRTALKTDVPMTALIAHPTLAELADVARESLNGHAESADLDRLLSDLEQLSDEEAERLLADRKSTRLNSSHVALS